jgi:pimeloyl-ACP methyl ester carboxylesterase
MSTQTSTGTLYTTSADGTKIAYEITGSGPTLVIVEGALCHRAMGTGKAVTAELASSYSVVGYDRRGRGESEASASPYDVQREIEDLIAVLDAVGPDRYVFAASSGAALALEASRQGVPIKKLVVYEAPFIVDDTHAPNALDLPAQIEALVAADKRSDAVKLFMRTVGVPAPMIAMMPMFPVWKGLKAVAHTIAYDFTIVVPFEQGQPLPPAYYDAVAPETIVIAGGKSPAYMQNAQAAIADQLRSGRLVTLKGQTHMIRARATVPVLREHFRD